MMQTVTYRKPLDPSVFIIIIALILVAVITFGSNYLLKKSEELYGDLNSAPASQVPPEESAPLESSEAAGQEETPVVSETPPGLVEQNVIVYGKSGLGRDLICYRIGNDTELSKKLRYKRPVLPVVYIDLNPGDDRQPS